MNSFSTFGIFVFWLLAYCTPTEGNFEIKSSMFENGDSYTPFSGPLGRSYRLVKYSHSTYGIEETRQRNRELVTSTAAKFEMEGIDLMVGADLVLRTKDNSYLQIELINSQNSKTLFTMSTRPKLNQRLYSYKVSVIQRYEDSHILVDVSLSGYKYSTTGTTQHRYIIHLGDEFNCDKDLRLLWTEKDFNYFIYDNYSIILTLVRKPKFKNYNYYLLRFDNKSDLDEWFADPGRYYSNDIPVAPREVQNHFLRYVSKLEA